MRRLAFALAALLLLRADMYPDASNAKLPEALQELGLVVTAKCDVAYRLDGAATAGSAAVVSATSDFTGAAGKRLVIAGAGAAPFSVLTAKSAPAVRGSGYVAEDTIVLAGGTASVPAVVFVDTVDGAGAVLTWHMQDAGVYTVVPANPVAQASTTGSGTGFSLTAQFVGEPLTGTIVSGSGITATLDTVAGNSVAAMAFYYGSDDAAALQAALSTPGTVPLMLPAGGGAKGAGCGTSVQLEMPVEAAIPGGAGSMEVSGARRTQTTIYPLARMAAVLNRGPGFTTGGGVFGLSIDAFYLADHAFRQQGGNYFTLRDVTAMNARVATVLCDGDVGVVGGHTYDNVRALLQPQFFSSRQRPDYQIQIKHCSDGAMIAPTGSVAKLAVFRANGAETEWVIPHAFNAGGREYISDYAIDMQSKGQIYGGHIDNARVSGVYVGAGNISIFGMALNNFFGVRTANGITIKEGVGNVTVAGVHTNIVEMRPENMIVQEGVPNKNNNICRNTSASYIQCPLMAVTVAELPDCSGGYGSPQMGTQYMVIDATVAPTYNSTPVGGGSVIWRVTCSGSAWKSY